MKRKKLITLLLAGAILTGALTGCSAPREDTAATTEITTAATTAEATTAEAVTEAVSEDATEVVTDKDGKAVTEVVTDAKGKEVTEKNGEKKTQLVTKKSGTSKPKTTTKKNSSTTKKSKTTTTAATQEPQPISIVLQKNRQATCQSPNVSLATGEVYIEKGGDYVITSETSDWHGQIIVKLANTEKCEIRFEGSGTISNDTKNIIQIIDSSINSDRTFLEAEATAGTDADDEIKAVSDNDKAPNVDISFPTGANWTFQTSGNGYTGVLYNESKLTLKGNGKANFTSVKNANNCVCSTKSITVKNVALTMETVHNTTTSNVAKNTGSAKGIFSYSKVVVESGSLSIKSNGDAIRCDKLEVQGGTVNISSSACDGVDADDAIVISGGTVYSKALEKHSYKVRRVNNEEKAQEQKAAGSTVTVADKNRVRSGKGDGFFISGGTVTGESKKISSLNAAHQSDKKASSQPSITCKIVKENKGLKEESKVPAIINIGTLNKSSANKCIKFLYSSPSVTKGTGYKVTVGEKSSNVTWSGNFGFAEIASATNK